MADLRNDTIGGYNTLINDQKNEVGETNVTTVLFNNEITTLHDCTPIQEVKLLTRDDYFPCGTTALLDAIGTTVDSVGNRLANTPEQERPYKVIIAIMTDGYENASQEYNKTQIKQKIEHQQEKYDWTFMFIGAGIDAVTEGSSLGIMDGFSVSVQSTSGSTIATYDAISKMTSASKVCINNTAFSTEAAKIMNELKEGTK